MGSSDGIGGGGGCGSVDGKTIVGAGELLLVASFFLCCCKVDH